MPLALEEKASILAPVKTSIIKTEIDLYINIIALTRRKCSFSHNISQKKAAISFEIAAHKKSVQWII